MKKILTIARREYQAMVATKAFLIGLAMMPVMMLGGTFIPRLLQGMETAQDRRIIVVDRTGQLFQALKTAADQRNRLLADDTDSAATKASSDPDREQKEARKAMGMEEIHRYVLEELAPELVNDEKRLELSQEISNRRLYAFIEIPPEILTGPQSGPNAAEPSDSHTSAIPAVNYVAEDAALADARRWTEQMLNQIVRAQRLSASVSATELPVVMKELDRRVTVSAGGLYYRDQSGKIVSAEKPNELAMIFLPMGIMMLMFMIIMMSAQPMLESVLEEKTLRISEVLLGSANAQQLMIGKLLGNVAGSLTVFALYATGGLAWANFQGHSSSIPYSVLPWFVVYQILAVLLFSSIFMAIAASVSQLREAQGLLLPVWMMMLLPMFVWFNVVREPNSTLATTLSFFPPSTPLMMTLRLSTGAAIPIWQIILSMVVLVLGTGAGVTAAARIYRIGILWQGKTPSLKELVVWLVRNPLSN